MISEQSAISASTGRLRRKRLLQNVLLATAATLLTLVLLDVALIVTNLFPPSVTTGDAVAGWRSAYPTGRMVVERCWDVGTGIARTFTRNEDGVRTEHTSAELRGALVAIGVSGDSHTDLCAPNDSVHFGVLERALRGRGVQAGVFAYGAGKYSPLQAYLAVRANLEAYNARAFILNLYTGNDFLDLLRIDDRPHLIPDSSGYRVAPPVWYQELPPGTVPRSRVLFAFGRAFDRTGIPRAWVRFRYLLDAARSQGQGLASVVRYMRDLQRASSASIGYPQALSAQIFNQQLFFHRFPGSREESVRRLAFLLSMIRQQHPDRLLVLSPIPSYEVVFPAGGDPVFRSVLSRLPITYEQGVREEDALYEAALQAGRVAGWVVVDNRPALRELAERAERREMVYNTFDYHITEQASEVIGGNEAEVLAGLLSPTLKSSASNPSTSPKR